MLLLQPVCCQYSACTIYIKLNSGSTDVLLRYQPAAKHLADNGVKNEVFYKRKQFYEREHH